MSIAKDFFLISLVTPIIILLAFWSDYFSISLVFGVLVLFLIKKYYSLKRELVLQREYFIKTLSHDLRVSTLAQIRALDVLKKSDSSDNRDLIVNISDSCKYTFDMITMLLNTYRYENGESVLNYEVVNLPDLLAACYNDLQPLLNDKKLELDFHINNLKNIEADRYGITKLVNILVSTAVNNSISGETVIVEANKMNNKIEFSVNYSGKSLTDEECRRMFSDNPRFSTVGHGIKMLLCKKIIDFHKGDIYIKSERNNNSFVFSLPFVKNCNNHKTPLLTALQPFNS